jgi:hypothetical protein
MPGNFEDTQSNAKRKSTKKDVGTFARIEEAFQEIEEGRRKSTPEDRRRGRRFTWVFFLYFLFFMIPDSAWINMGIRIPENSHLPASILKMIELSPFPVSMFMFWLSAPFFMILALGIAYYVTMSIPWPSPEYERYAALREKKIKAGKWNSGLACALGLVIGFWWIVFDSNMIDPSLTFVKAWNPFQYKLPFYLFFGMGITVLMPIIASIFINECRFYIFSMTYTGE